jgi:hypothetical protein
VNNPLRILETLDRYLSAPAELTLFGRAALALGFPNSPTEYGATQDVDAILPLDWLGADDQNMDFWQAQQRTNTELESRGLYLTHLFREVDVILTPDWLKKRIRITNEFKRLTIFRPSTLDLILTKMARADENDLQDIRFLVRQEPITAEQLAAAFACARIPEVPEIRQLFMAAAPKALALVNSD